MRYTIPVTICLLVLLSSGCGGWTEYYGGIYHDPISPGDGSGGSYDPYDEPHYAQDVVGQWEGFMNESYRSDGRPCSKKTIAINCSYSQGSSSGEYVKVNVIVDGRPAGSGTSRVGSGGRISVSSHQGDIDFGMSGRFSGGSGSGDMEIRWEEKFENGYGYIHMEYVRIRGDFGVHRVHGGHWAAAWALFDTYGDGVWDLGDEIWTEATAEGIAHLESLEPYWETVELRQ